VFHHIRHWAHGGKSEEANGAILCLYCHADAHKGDLTPYEILFCKTKKDFLWHEPITYPQHIDEVLASAPIVEKEEAAEYDVIIQDSVFLLSKLRQCLPGTDSQWDEWRRARARMKLRLAGALTCTEPAEDVEEAVSNRYLIDLLASAARQTGEKLSDHFLEFQAVHSLATNANSLGPSAFGAAMGHALQLYKWLDEIKQIKREQPAYAAYTAMNISEIIQKAGDDSTTDRLIKDSLGLAETKQPEWMVRQGEVLCMRGKFVEAGSFLEEGLRMLPANESPIRHVVASRVYGLFLCLIGERDKGEGEFERAAHVAGIHRLGHQRRKIEVMQTRLKLPDYEAAIGGLTVGGLKTNKTWVLLPRILLELF
jgi:hypothetical protein